MSAVLPPSATPVPLTAPAARPVRRAPAGALLALGLLLLSLAL